MMRGVSNWSLAVRKPDESIALHSWPLESYMQRYPVLKMPILRGVVALVESLVIGMKAISISANESLGQEEEQLTQARDRGHASSSRWRLRSRLFFLAPLGFTGLFRHWLGSGLLLLARRGRWCASRSSSSTWPWSRASPICAACSNTTAPSTWPSTPSSTPTRLRRRRARSTRRCTCAAARRFCSSSWSSRSWCSPPSGGRPGTCSSSAAWCSCRSSPASAYEIVKVAGRHEANPVVRFVMAPGLALQWMTTRKPDDGVSSRSPSAALERIIELEPADAPVPKGVEIMA